MYFHDTLVKHILQRVHIAKISKIFHSKKQAEFHFVSSVRKVHFLTLFLDVLETNERAREMYIKCGFKMIDKNTSFLRYKLTLYNDSIIDN